MSTRSDLGTISTLLGDALSQFAKLFQNEVDLAKAELGEKVQQVGWTVGFLAAGAVLVIPALVMALFALSAALMRPAGRRQFHTLSAQSVPQRLPARCLPLA